MSRRAQILEMITMETNRLGSTRDEKARASLEAVIEFLKAQVSDMDSQMLEIVRSNLELKTLDELLQSVPGVGPVLSATMPAATQPVRCIFRVKTGAFYGQEAVRTVEYGTFVLVERM